MDVLGELLEALGLWGQLEPLEPDSTPMGARAIPDDGDVYLVHPLAGNGSIRVQGAESPCHFSSGDMLLVARGGAYQVASEGWEAVRIRFTFRTPFDHPLLSNLPGLIHLRGEGGEIPTSLSSLMAWIVREHREARPGRTLVLERLMPVLFVEILRAVAVSDQAGGFPGPLRDKAVYRAIQKLHESPGSDWTLERLAGVAALSRSGFAARFKARVGMGPMTYLTRWRMVRARQLLVSTDLPIKNIAGLVGYGSDIAFNRAFRRTTGFTPGSIRRAAATRRLGPPGSQSGPGSCENTL